MGILHRKHCSVWKKRVLRCGVRIAAARYLLQFIEVKSSAFEKGSGR